MAPNGNRFRRFALVGALGFIVVTLSLVLYTRDVAVREIERSGVAQHEALAVALARFHLDRLEPVLALSPDLDVAALRADRRVAALHEAIVPLLRELQVLRVKIYDARGRVVFSDAGDLIGERAGANAEWHHSMQGETVSEIIHRDTFNASDGVIENRDVLETYVPVVAMQGGEVFGVFEIYSDLTPLLLDLRRAHTRIVYGASGISLVFILLLAMWFRRTAVALETEQARNAQYVAELEDSRGHLEQRVAERTSALAASEQRLRDVIHTSGAYVWETDREGRFTYVSEPVEKVLGYRPEELIGRTPVQLMPAEDAAHVRRVIAQTGAEKPFHNLEHRSHTRSGGTVWLRANGLPVYAADGKRLGTRGACVDITGQRDAWQLAERYARVLEQTEDAVIVCNREGFIEYVNPAFVAATGYSLEEVHGCSPSLLKSGETPAEIYTDLWQTITAGRTWRGEVRNRNRQGEVYWDQLVISPVRDADGTIVQFVGTQVNITRQKERAIALRESEERLRAVMASVVDAVISIDDKGVIEMCNPAVEQLFGHETRDMIGSNITMLMPEPYSSEHADYLTHYVRGGEPRIIGVGGREVLGLRRDGTTFPLELSVGEMRLANERKFVGVLRNLTERKHAEQALEHARQQYLHREKMAAIGQFAAGIIHEVGNPVTAIVGALEELQRLRGKRDGDSQALERVTEKQLALIAEHATRITRITREISGFANPQPAEPTLLSVNDLVRGAVKLLRFDHRVREVGLELSLDDELPALEASADHLTQVLLNLIINAADACRVNGEVTPLVEIGTCRHEHHIEVYVRDNGIGMSAATLAAAFDPYFTTKTGDGLGLGLSLSDALVREHGGFIEASSEPGAGTFMRVYLPLAPVGVQEPA